MIPSMNPPKAEARTALSRFTRVDRRLDLGYGGVILGLMLTALAAGGWYFQDVMDREERQLASLLTQLLADSISRISFSGKHHAQLLLEDIQLNQPRIRYLFITDREGRVVASSDHKRLGARLTGETLALARRVQAHPGDAPPSRRVHHDGEPVLEILIAYRGGFGDEVRGVLLAGLSRQERDAALTQGMVFMGVLVLVLLGVGTLAVHWLSAYFASPVRQLAHDMTATLQALPDSLYEIDAEGRYLKVLAHRDEWGEDPHQKILGQTLEEVMPAPAANTVRAALLEANQHGESHGRRFHLALPDGDAWFELSVARKTLASGEPRFIMLSRDISARKQAENRLYLYANVFRHSAEAIIITDADNLIVATNPALTRLTGYTETELLGKDPKVLSSGLTPRETYREMWRDLKEAGHWQGELNDRHKDGEPYPKWVSISEVRDHRGHLTNYIASFTDITERKAAEARINYLAYHDALTGLFNRLSLEERLAKAIDVARGEQTLLAVLFIDMDRFKLINDTLGHHMGDLFLIEVGRRLQAVTRDEDIVARLGGDEFVVVATAFDTLRDVAAIAANIIDRLHAPYQIERQHLRSSPSVGIGLFPQDGEDWETLMRCADTAMYHAKEQGRDNYQFFTSALNTAAHERMEMERDLRFALEQHQFNLHYQPKIGARDGRLNGVEALLRWQHPERGRIPPDKFIPVAEETGLIQELGLWVLDEACHQLATWREEGVFGVQMAVNLSIEQLRNPGLIGQLKAIMDRHDIAAGELQLEVTETAAMAQPEQAIVALNAIRELGVELAIDDFGTGYSSLAYLKSFPIQTLKLDRAFVSDIEHDENDAAICAATISLAHNLGLKVVAEGVETEAQRAFLITHRYDTLQGYLICPPLPPERLTPALRNAPIPFVLDDAPERLQPHQIGI